MLRDFKVNITETVTRTVLVTAETPAEAQRIVEENYSSEVVDVEFEVDTLSNRLLI
jgi:hypothetical protein